MLPTTQGISPGLDTIPPPLMPGFIIRPETAIIYTDNESKINRNEKFSLDLYFFSILSMVRMISS